MIEKKYQAKYQKYEIGPPPRFPFELRTIIHSTKNLVFKDELAKCNDAFVRGYPGSSENA